MYLSDNSYCRDSSDSSYQTMFPSENLFSLGKKHLYTKITQPLYTKNRVTSSHKKSRNLSTNKKTQTPPQKNHVTSRKINHATWVSKWGKSPLYTKIMQPLAKKIAQPLHTKSHAISQQKITQTIHTQNHVTSQKKITQPVHQKKSCNLSTKKSCKLCKKNHATSKKNYAISHQKNHATSQKKIMQSPQKKSCNLQKNKSGNLSEWVRQITQTLHTQKSCNLSTHKIIQPLKKNYATSPPKTDSKFNL